MQGVPIGHVHNRLLVKDKKRGPNKGKTEGYTFTKSL